MNANNTLTIDGTSSADTITVQKNSTNNNYIEVLVNSTSEWLGRISSVGKIEINGGDGNDTITVDSAITLTTTINGEGGNDSITGGYGRDVVYGGAGNDIAYGRDGNDWFDGGSGTDLLDGGAGDDQFMALDEEVDTLYGGSGWDSATCDLGVIVEDANTFIEEFLA